MSAQIPDPALIEEAVALAARLQICATALQTPHERRQQAELDRMLRTPSDKVTMLQMTDQAFRSQGAARTVDQFTHILDVQGIPRFFSPIDRALLHGFQTFGGWLPGVSVPLVKDRMQSETANVVLPAERELLTAHLRDRQAAGLRMNVNFLGEALLGETTARERLEKYLEALQFPELEVLSVKISTLFSQISALARPQTIATLCDRLELLYREAAHLHFTRTDGTQVPKFVYLDMEEYRDLELTAEVFMQTLDRPGLEDASAGIALQAYIPDSARVQHRILEWARARVAAGRAPITMRLVKGANMEMERVEASVRGWPQAPFKTKLETDANYKRMLHAALSPENRGAVRVGIASHNLFDVAYGLLLSERTGAGDRVQFEMLEGMANHQRRALFEHSPNLLLYAPACQKTDFLNAIGYLIRRLDENTGPENFLRHAFKLQVGSEDWRQLEAGFRQSFEVGLSDAPRRTQNRLAPLADGPRPEMSLGTFRNAADTDFSLPANSRWAAELVGQPPLVPPLLPVVVDGEERLDGRPTRDCLDPSRPGEVITRCAQATATDLADAVACADQDPDRWRTLSLDQRSEILAAVAAELRKARGILIQAAIANGGKTVVEADPEVSEAIDFVEFYRSSARVFFALPTVTAQPRGVVAVIPPWNFPIAIPCGGMAAALAAGNRVLLKPASDAAFVAWELCQCFWRAGVSRRVLQFVPCSGSDAGAHLLSQPQLGAVILTGGTATAQSMLRARPDLRLYAETGGKNATIVTALSDRDQAVKHVVHSAFSHSGQKCSATSLLLLEAEVYDDPAFRRLLADAVESLPVGSAWDLTTRVGPLIRPPSGDLEQALKTLEPGESWLVMPTREGDNPNLWSPGVKWGVSPGSVTHLTEFFGPVLGVMRFTSLTEAIELVNATGYGLTSGLESLDDREQQQWQNGIRAGNLYLNKPTTGAIVLRQPFGGMGASCFGPGMKAGGPNYVAQFTDFANPPEQSSDRIPASVLALSQDRLGNEHLADLDNRLRLVDFGAPPEQVAQVRQALVSYDTAWRQEFSIAHDHFRLLGEDNFRRYLSLQAIRIRANAATDFFSLFAAAAAACLAGCRLTVSAAEESPILRALDEATDSWGARIEFLHEDQATLARALKERAVDRVRWLSGAIPTAAVWAAAHEQNVYIAREPVLREGRIELLRYLREQSISHAYHRYGNLGGRSTEPRHEPM